MSNLRYWRKDLIANSMMGFLGIEILPSKDENVVEARMPLDYKVAQPFGVLSGGASLAMAEIVAGCGSFILCDAKQIPVGSNVSGTHIASVKIGEQKYIYAHGVCLHKGRSTHLWNMDIATEDGKLISTVRVTNFLVEDKFDDKPEVRDEELKALEEDNQQDATLEKLSN
ncbi:MAG: PaaI family thioesterase [Burkholderiales bacterium]|nr:PaaI family thioesterase [Burkholderiales bacterium]